MKIFYTSDIHGYFMPTDYMDMETKPMGLISAGNKYVKSKDNLFIDCGDILQGSVFAYYLSENNNSKAVADIVNKIGIDFITVGNHDFNYGYDYLKGYLNNVNAKCICANLVDEKGEITNLTDHVIVEIEGKKIGIIGAVTDWVNVWEKEKNLVGFQIKDTLSSLVKAYENIKDCDYKICLYHGGIDFDPVTKEIVENSGENISSRIIDAIDIDLILCGHQHLEILAVDYKGTKVIQPSFFGGKYAEIDINLENKDLKVKLCDIDGNFDEEKFSEEILLNNKINEYIDRKIATLDKDYLPKDRLEMALNGSELASFINKIQLELTGADVSMNALANEVSGFKKDLTIRQILNTLRYPNTLEVYEIDGKTLRRGLNKNFEYIVKDENGYRINEDYIIPKLSHYNFDFYDGITYDIDLDKPFDSRIGNIYKDGRVIKDDEILTIVLNNYRSTGVSGFDMYKGLKLVKKTDSDISQLFIDYFKNKYNKY